MNVHAYLEAAGQHPWRWGYADCTLFAGDWALAKCGRDPGVCLRGTYSTEKEAAEIIKHAGGMVAFIGWHLGAIGWSRVVSPEDGDIGVVSAPLAPLGHVGLIPAIRAGGLWVIRTLHGQRAAMFKHEAVWRG